MAILVSSVAYAADNQYFTPPRTEISDSVAADPSGEWRLSTSLPAWIAGVTNIAGEYVFSRHWSAGLYMSYSGWNYFRQTQKFRVAEFRPEVRYWFGGNARGFFVEGHLAVISYNVALPSWNFRYQDRGGSHPALGGGVGAGFRCNLTGDGVWQGEAAVGFGGYYLDYDRFENTGPQGRLVDSKKRGFFGIDHFTLSIVYSFSTNKR